MAGGAAMWRLVVKHTRGAAPCETAHAEAGQLQSRRMAKVILKDLKKVYPNTEKKKKVKKGEEAPEKKNNLQITDEGVVAVQQFSLEIADQEFIVLVGPSGCGKSTFLKSLTRMNDLVEGCRISGDIKLDGVDIYKDKMDVNVLRKRVGMVFQKPNPFPMSIYDNIAYGPRTHGVRSKARLDEIVEKSLRDAAIWDEVEDRLNKSALGMSGGQQQRLCIARALAVEPEVLLMDEPTSALDPISTSKVEELATELKEKYTIVMVTHNMQQAARISDKTAFFLLGELVEMGPTERVFATPVDKRTEDYISGRFG